MRSYASKAAVFVLSVYASAAGRSDAQVAFADGVFAGWTHQVVVVAPFAPTPPGPGSTGSMTVVGGGNPGSALQMANTVAVNAGIENVALNPSAVYVPAVSGPLQSLTFAIDAKGVAFPFAGDGQGVGVCCEQNGFLYQNASGVTGSTVGVWHAVASATIAPSLLVPVIAGSPPFDASVAGAPITFGFVVLNGTCFNCSGYSTTVSYDNWSVTIGSAPLYPGSGMDFRLRTSTSSAAVSGASVKSISAFGPLSIALDSPLGGFVGAPLVLAAGFATTGAVPFPGPPLWLAPSTAIVLIDGFAATPFGFAQTVSPLGNVYGFVAPPGLAGLSLFVQAASIGAPGLAFTDAHEIRFL